MPGTTSRFFTRRIRGKYPRFKRRKLPIVTFLLVALFIFFALLLAWKGYKSWRNNIWLSGMRLTLVVAKNSPQVYSFNPQTGKVYTFTIPQNTLLKASRDFGDWFAGSLWNLGNQKGGAGGELLQKTIQRNFGIPVDAWIEEEGEFIFQPNQSSWLGNWTFFSKKYQTNLSFFDQARLKSALDKTNTADLRAINLVSQGVIVQTVLDDGVSAYKVVPERASLVFEVLRDDLIFAQGETVSITNASGESGLAAQVAQIVAVLGARVIAVQTAEEGESGCVIRFDKAKTGLLTKRLTRLFNCQADLTPPLGPAEIEIYVGKKFAEEF